MKKATEAFLKGYRSFPDGENIYRFGTEAWNEWESGWCFADYEDCFSPAAKVEAN